MTEADANVDDNQSYQEWTKAGAKQISNQIGEIHLEWYTRSGNTWWRWKSLPDCWWRWWQKAAKQNQPPLIERRKEREESRNSHLSDQEGTEQKTWSTAPLKFEMPGPGKVTNIPAVAFSPSTCSKSWADLKKPLQKKLWRRRNLIIPSRTGEHINCILWLSTSVFSTLWIELTWEKCNCKKAKSKKKISCKRSPCKWRIQEPPQERRQGIERSCSDLAGQNWMIVLETFWKETITIVLYREKILRRKYISCHLPPVKFAYSG